MGVSGRQFSPDVGEHPWSRVSLSRLHAGPMTEGQHPHTHPRGRWESAPHTSLCLCDKVAGGDVVGGRRKDTGALCQCGVGAAEGVTEAGSQGEGGWGPHTTPAGEGGGVPRYAASPTTGSEGVFLLQRSLLPSGGWVCLSRPSLSAGVRLCCVTVTLPRLLQVSGVGGCLLGPADRLTHLLVHRL